MTDANHRHSDLPIDKLFLDRWSPRAFTGEEIPEADLMTMFEAARWAPSSYNSQPWRFIYGRRGTPHFDTMLSLLIEFNQSWAKTASALVVLVSHSLMTVPGKDKPVPSHSHSMDAGAAWGSLALQASLMGWQAHGMVGFDMERAFAELGMAEGCRVEQAIAIGRVGDKNTLPAGLAARETPSDRLPLSQIVMEGAYKAG
jgi:nitroreductase